MDNTFPNPLKHPEVVKKTKENCNSQTHNTFIINRIKHKKHSSVSNRTTSISSVHPEKSIPGDLKRRWDERVLASDTFTGKAVACSP